MEGEKDQNSPLQPTCFIIYNGKLSPPVIYQYSDECFQPISLIQYHRGFWLFSLKINTLSNKNIELHISQPRSATKLYIFPVSTLSTFKFIDITQSEELVSFPEFNSFFTSAVFNHKINFSFDSSDQLEDINLFLSSFTTQKNNKLLNSNLYNNSANSIDNNNNNIHQTQNLSQDTAGDKNELENPTNAKRDTSFHFSENFNNNNHDKNDEYLIWALLFISCQPWYSLFQYNEGLSRLLIKYITPFILRNFFLYKTEVNCTDFKKCQNNFDCNFNTDFDFDFSVNSKRLSSYQKFKSAQPFVDTLILFIRAQLGDSIAYIVSCIFSNREKEEKRITYSDLRFSFTSSVSSISSSISVPSSAFSAEGNPSSKKRSMSFEMRQPNDQISIEYAPSILTTDKDENIRDSDTDFILNELLKIVRDDEDRQNLFAVFLTVATRGNKFECKPPLFVDNLKMAQIICERLLFTSHSYSNSDQDFEYFISLIPNQSEVVALLCQGKYFVPFEWLSSFKKLPLFQNKLTFTSLIQNSLRNSTSRHLLASYANVTPSGALYYGDIDLTSRVLQPGSILQTDVACRRFSMMMAGSVALSGSVLIENCYSPRNAIVLPMTGAKAIDETAEVEMPVKLKKGVIIDHNCFIGQNAKIGAGSKIGANVYLSENVRVHKGCLICEGEMVPHNFDVPTGFIYRGEVVEFARRLPRIIRRSRASLFFYKQMSGFVDLEAVLAVDASRAFILDFLETFKEFPAECGRQLAINCHRECFALIDESSLYGIFKLNALILVMQFWKTRDQIRIENEGDQIETENQNSCNKDGGENRRTVDIDEDNQIENKQQEDNENNEEGGNQKAIANQDEIEKTNEHQVNAADSTSDNKANENRTEANQDDNAKVGDNDHLKNEEEEEEEEFILVGVELFEKAIFNLANIAFDDLIENNSNSQLLTIDDFLEDEMVTSFVYKLAKNLPYFVEKGINAEKIENVKKFLFELVDEVIVRKSIFANAERKRTFQILQNILEITQIKNDE